MFAVEVYAAVRPFVFIAGNSRREGGQGVRAEPRDGAEDVPLLTPAGLPTYEANREAEAGASAAETIGTRLLADRAALRGLPAVQLEPCEKRAARVSSTALVRYRRNDYSVPTAYGFRDVLVKGFVEEVVILCGGVEIARHPRSYGTGVFVSEPLHNLALIETKPNARDQAAALQGWDLPEVFQYLRHLLEACMGNRGKREFIQVLRLMEAMPKDVVTLAATEAIRLGRSASTRSS